MNFLMTGMMKVQLIRLDLLLGLTLYMKEKFNKTKMTVRTVEKIKKKKKFCKIMKIMLF